METGNETCCKLPVLNCFHKSNFIFSFVIKVMKVMFANHQFAIAIPIVLFYINRKLRSKVWKQIHIFSKATDIGD